MNPPRVVLLALCLVIGAQAEETETIVCLRHGEKTPSELGQLSVEGFNRALVLPEVLLHRYGAPQFIFAPDPAKNLVGGRNGVPYRYYLRPLMTIEPTAIRCGLPVNTAFGYKEIEELERELLRPIYRNSLIFVAWEHHFLADFVTKITADVGNAPRRPFAWPAADYDSLYVIRIRRSASSASVSLEHEHEGIDHPSGRFPTAAD